MLALQSSPLKPYLYQLERSPTFCICELFGILLVFIWCALHIGIPNRAICIAQSFILPIGVTLLAGYVASH